MIGAGIPLTDFTVNKVLMEKFIQYMMMLVPMYLFSGWMLDPKAFLESYCGKKPHLNTSLIDYVYTGVYLR